MSLVLLRRRLNAVTCGLCATLMLPLAASGAPDDAPAAGNPVQRPRVGLVLAGGGAKGGAHVGVLKVLEEQHVQIDCIAGTSMGALVGAGYAAGMPAAELEKFLVGIDWNAVVGGAGGRQLESAEQKRMKVVASAGLELGIKDGRVVTPGGLTNTSGIDDLLRSYVARARMVPDFDRLPIPYRAVATDMVKGEMVVLDRGDLATAMRASMAIPGAFAPVVQGKYILSDGGQVRNIPVDVARQTCADVVIVVNLVEPETPPEKLVQATQLLSRSMDVMIQANENLQLGTLTDRDVRIDVPMGDIGTSDFTRVPETIPLGEAAARKVVDQLARYSVAPEAYATWRARVTTPQEIEARVAAVRFEGLEWVNPAFLETVTKIRPGDHVNIDAISDDAMRVSALDEIDSVSYGLEGNSANPTLVWRPQESSVGHNVLRPSLGIYASGHADFKFLLGAQFVRYWMNDLGGQLRGNVQVGFDSLATLSWYQPFDVAQRFFVEPEIFAARSIEDVFVDNDRIGVYRFKDIGASIDLGANLGHNGQVRLGYLTTQRRSEIDTGIAQLPSSDVRVPEVDARDAGLVAAASYDSRDRDVFARRGFAAQLQYTRSDESLGADREWSTVEAAIRKALPFGRNAVWVSLAGGTDLGSNIVPGDRAFSLGGPRTLPAYQFDELRVGSYWLADVTVLWRVMDVVAVKNQSIYAGLGLQAAGLYDRVDLVDDGEIYSAAAFLGGPTPIGTITVGIGGSSDSWGFWLSVGRPIGKGSILDSGLFR